MSFKNRTREFAATVSSIQARRRAPLSSHTPSSVANRLGGDADSPNAPLLLHMHGPPDPAPSLGPGRSSSAAVVPGAQSLRSEFTLTAREIAAGIQSTSARLEQLGRLAKRKTLFDDRPHEISMLTSVIKNDITTLNSTIRKLQEIATRSSPSSASLSSASAGGRQKHEHSESVVFGLQSSLARTSQSFAELLEVRTENLRAQKERRDQYSAVPGVQSGALAFGGPLSSNLYTLTQRGSARTTGADGQQLGSGADISSNFNSNNSAANNNAGIGHVAIDMQMTQSEIAQIDVQAAYLEQRNTAVESIERTIGELAQIFQQLGTLVAQQREQVMRIDDNVIDIESNVDLARRELFKFWTSMSSNRALMVKVFAVVLVFFFIFLLIL